MSSPRYIYTRLSLQATHTIHVTYLTGRDAYKVKFQWKLNEVRSLGLFAGGTGVTSIMQLVEKLCADKEDNTLARLLTASVCCNKT
jgi:hypothetical protein